MSALLYFFCQVKRFLPFFSLLVAWSCEPVPDTRARFTVTIENLTSAETASVLAAGIYFTQSQGNPLFFNLSFDYGDGLELLAEDGIADTLFANIQRRPEILESGTFPDILPGESRQFTFEASYGDYFNFATMFVESNDLFYAFHDGGFSLFEPDGEPITGEFASKVFLWDAGTEENEPPYTGEFQPGRQNAVGDGVATPNEPVRLLDDGFDYPAKTAVISIIFSPTKI